MDRADEELARIRRGAEVEIRGAALAVVPSHPDALWMRGCVAVELCRKAESVAA